MSATSDEMATSTRWRRGHTPRPQRLVGVRDTFLCQGPTTAGWVVGGAWWGRAPGFPVAQRWLITKIRRRGDTVKIWGVQWSPRDGGRDVTAPTQRIAV